MTFYEPKGVSPEEAGGNLNVRLVLRPTIPHPDLSYLVASDHPDSGVRLNSAPTMDARSNSRD